MLYDEVEAIFENKKDLEIFNQCLAEAEAFISFLFQLLPRADPLYISEILFNHTKKLSFADQQHKATANRSISTPNKKVQQQTAPSVTTISDVSSMAHSIRSKNKSRNVNLLKTTTSNDKSAQGVSNISYQSAFDMHTENLCQLDQSVIVSQRQAVGFVKILEDTGQTIIDGNCQAYLIDSHDTSFLSSKRKILQTNSEMLTGAVCLFKATKLVISTVKGRLFVYNLSASKNKELKRVASIESSSDCIFTMQKIFTKQDNCLIVGGNGICELLSISKSTLGVIKLNRISMTTLAPEARVLKILNLSPFSGSGNQYLMAFGLEQQGLRIGSLNEKEGVLGVKKSNQKFMQGVPSVNGAYQTQSNQQDMSISISLKNQKCHTINDIVEIAPGEVIVSSYTECKYYIIDLKTGYEGLVGSGVSKRSLNLQLFPNFHLTYFPFILCKEDRFLCILNLRERKAYALQKCDDKYANGFRLQFLPQSVAQNQRFQDHVMLEQQKFQNQNIELKGSQAMKVNQEIELDWIKEDIKFMTTSVQEDFEVTHGPEGKRMTRQSLVNGSIQQFKVDSNTFKKLIRPEQAIQNKALFKVAEKKSQGSFESHGTLEHPQVMLGNTRSGLRNRAVTTD